MRQSTRTAWLFVETLISHFFPGATMAYSDIGKDVSDPLTIRGGSFFNMRVLSLDEGVVVRVAA